ncbi:MAG TPA: hypothetical protein VGN61_04245 [Verrucomicrobiae bacterium]
MAIRKRIASLILCQSKLVWQTVVFSLVVFLLLLLSARSARAGDTNLEAQVQALQQQNALLQQQLEKQNQSIEALSKKVEDLEATGTRQENAAEQNAPPPAPTGYGGYNLGSVNLSAEGGLAFFNTDSDGFSPHSDFRVDEARLFVEAPVWKEVYFQGEVDLATRENDSLTVQMGELYLDAEDLSQLWGRDGQLNLRAGQMWIPFGEEYLSRYAIDDPLISHSVSDIWGYGPGVELYGALSKFNYVVAVQNDSGRNGVQDFNGDKAVTGRIGYDPNKHLHFSVSAMRTGDLNVQNDQISSLWFGGELLQPLGGPLTTLFHEELAEGDVAFRWASGHVSAFGGYGRYGDNDPHASNGRNFFFYSAEGMQSLPKKFFAAIRFSEVLSDKGMPIPGLGSYGEYGEQDDLATELWRLSLGIGYRFSDNLLIKTEYSFEGGNDIDGDSRDREDFFGTEAAFKF